MQTHKLMIKTHKITKLKYLCYTKSDGEKYDSYKGSGKLWKSHLKKYGNDITTELIFESDNFEQFKKIAIEKSLEYDVVNSDSWANLKIEEGDGGDTVSNKKWITDGQKDKYINRDEDVPVGWKLGRSNCIFNDREKQREFGKKCDLKKRGAAIKKAWDDGKMNNRDHSKCGVRGEANSSKRLEVRNKISNSRKKKIVVRGIQFPSIGDAITHFGVSHKTIHRWVKNEIDNTQAE
jgi:hypothetical protein